MILSRRGYKVSVFEREEDVGGRNRDLVLGKYHFDTGPTFLMMDFLLKEVFELAGRNWEDYLELVKLEPMYKLSFLNGALFPTTDHSDMKTQLDRMFPGNSNGLDRFLKDEGKRYAKLFPCLKKDYSTLFSMINPTLLKALPYLSLDKSLYRNLGRYYHNELCRLSFTFQAKYLGMSPWDCPGGFTIIPYIEHAFGITHAIGGLCKISEAMARIIVENGGKIHLGQRVTRILADSKRNARGVLLEGGERVSADAVVINADFGHAMETLFEPGYLKKYARPRLDRKRYSCSTFMIYLGLDKLYEEPHHNIIFARNYKENLEDISRGHAPSEDMSIYVRNASITDPTLAPKGHSALYILVPVANAFSGFEWTEGFSAAYRNRVLDRIERRTSMGDIRSHIVEEHTITPMQWQNDYHIYRGSTFNLAHNLTQLLYLRPRNRFEECGRCYLVGGGTHPGSGLPTIYESGRISANLVTKDIR